MRPRWSPDSKLLGLLDKQVAVYDVANRSLRVVTSSPTAITSYSWAPSGEAILYLANDKGLETGSNRCRSQLSLLPRVPATARRRGAEAAHESGSPRLVVRGISGCIASGVCRSATPRNRDAFNVDLYELNLRTGSEKTLVAQPGRMPIRPIRRMVVGLPSIRKQDLRITSTLVMSRLCLPAEEPYATSVRSTILMCFETETRLSGLPIRGT